MRRIHTYIAIFIFIIMFTISYTLKFPITNYTTQNLITAFAIFFGFYLTTISTLFGSKYMIKLKEIEDSTKTYTADIVLYKYFLMSGSWSLFSIVTILIFSFMSKLNNDSELVVLESHKITVFFNALIIGISAVNILFVLIIFKMLLGGLLHENYEDNE